MSDRQGGLAGDWLGRGWRTFDLDDAEAIAIWDSESPFLAVAPRAVAPLLERAAATELAGLREALDRQR